MKTATSTFRENQTVDDRQQVEKVPLEVNIYESRPPTQVMTARCHTQKRLRTKVADSAQIPVPDQKRCETANSTNIFAKRNSVQTPSTQFRLRPGTIYQTAFHTRKASAQPVEKYQNGQIISLWDKIQQEHLIKLNHEAEQRALDR